MIGHNGGKGIKWRRWVRGTSERLKPVGTNLHGKAIGAKAHWPQIHFQKTFIKIEQPHLGALIEAFAFDSQGDWRIILVHLSGDHFADSEWLRRLPGQSKEAIATTGWENHGALITIVS